MTATRKLQRKKAPREWLIRNLTTSVILYEHVKTTEARAKEARRFVDRIINLGKSDSLADRRRLMSWVSDRAAAKKIIEVLAPRYADRVSGYSRLIRLGTRVGDGAPSFLIELIPGKDKVTKPVVADTAMEVIETKETRRGVARLRKPKADVTVRRRSTTTAKKETK